MGLLYPQSTWCHHLWQGHVTRFASAQTVLADGTARQPAFPGLAQDMHDSLYLRHTPEPLPDAPAWAATLLDTAQGLQEWHQLRQRCLSNGFAAGLAAEQILRALVPLVPQADPEKPSQDAQKPQDGTQPPGESPGEGGGSQHAGARPGAPEGVRRTLRQACRDAGKQIDQAERETEALQAALGRHAGQGPGTPETLQDLADVRALYALLQGNPTLRHIADLAGRMHRLGQADKKTRLEPAVGAITGVTLGGDLSRILPGELAGLRAGSRLLRLQTLDKILSKRALEYRLRGEESLTRGPIIALVDESGSMGCGPESPCAWAKAVCLALLTTAAEQRRAFHLVGFSGHNERSSWREALRHELHVDAEVPAPLDAVAEALLWGSSGGTSFEAPLRRALELLAVSPDLKQADVVLITDGEADIHEDVQADLLSLRRTDGVQLYGVLVGDGVTPSALQPVCTALWHVHQTTDGAAVAPMLAAVNT